MDAPRITALQHRFIPAPQRSTRLAIVLHGVGDSMDGFEFLPQALGLPWLNYLLLNAPEPYGPGYAWFDRSNPQPGIADSRAKLDRLFAELDAAAVPTADRLLFGFSQGCLMSMDFGLRYGQPLAGIVGISGHTTFIDRSGAGFSPQAKQQAWLVTHGTEDTMLPIGRSRTQVQELRALGIPIEWHEFAKGHTLDPERELPLLIEWIARRWA